MTTSSVKATPMAVQLSTRRPRNLVFQGMDTWISRQESKVKSKEAINKKTLEEVRGDLDLMAKRIESMIDGKVYQPPQPKPELPADQAEQFRSLLGPIVADLVRNALNAELGTIPSPKK